MKINEFKVKTPQKPRTKQYIIGNGQVERELRAELEEYTEEVRKIREELAQYEKFILEYERRGKLLTETREQANRVPALLTEISDLRSALMEMSRVLKEDGEENATEAVAS